MKNLRVRQVWMIKKLNKKKLRIKKQLKLKRAALELELEKYNKAVSADFKVNSDELSNYYSKQSSEIDADLQRKMNMLDFKAVQADARKAQFKSLDSDLTGQKMLRQGFNILKQSVIQVKGGANKLAVAGGVASLAGLAGVILAGVAQSNQGAYLTEQKNVSQEQMQSIAIIERELDFYFKQISEIDISMKQLEADIKKGNITEQQLIEYKSILEKQ